jgi:hypothetical protein
MKKPFKISENNQKLIDILSKKYFGGHYTIFSFTTGYSFSFATVNSREGISELDLYDCLDDAIINAIQQLIIEKNF